MAWKVYTKTGGVLTSNFKDIDFNNIKALEGIGFAKVKVDMTTGEVFVNGQLADRNPLPEHYNNTSYKPIQYRKVVNLVGMFDFEILLEELRAFPEESQEKVALYIHLTEKIISGTITESETKELAEFIKEYTGEIPYKEFENQYVGYEYRTDQHKHKVEIEIDNETEAVVAIITTTDLNQEVKAASRYIRLL